MRTFLMIALVCFAFAMPATSCKSTPPTKEKAKVCAKCKKTPCVCKKGKCAECKKAGKMCAKCKAKAEKE